MADNHSPYDPDPRQGRGGDRRTQALQAVSHFSFKKPAFHFARSSQIAMGPDPVAILPPRPDFGATSARRLHRRHHTFGGTIAKLRNQKGDKRIAAPNDDEHFLNVHVNCSNQRSETAAKGRQCRSRRPERAKERAVARTKEQHAQFLHPAPALHLHRVSIKNRATFEASATCILGSWAERCRGLLQACVLFVPSD